MSKTEVEVRAFITKAQYNKLIKFFNKNSQFLKEDNQETIYFSGKEDLRIQRNSFFSKVWLKKGELHDNAREEIEVITRKNSFEDLRDLFLTLGYREEVKWLRKRMEFNWEGITVDIDYTQGYGYIIELEKLTNEQEKEQALNILREKLKKIDVIETPKNVFNQAYSEYKKNWKKLIN